MKDFYGRPIHKDLEQEKVRRLLKKYDDLSVTEELQKRIWDELTTAKEKGEIAIPFKVVLRRGTAGHYPDTIEVILDSKL